jgi:probable HAF family extracellular repeat protein
VADGYGGVTNNGWVTGDSFLKGDATEHAFVWRDGVMTDLLTFGGPNSGVGFPIKNNHGLIVGGAQGPKPDPLGENWGVAYVCIINGAPPLAMETKTCSSDSVGRTA